ncbi:MAG: hypothetical protein H0X17_03395 [Deltaproteobacteria bacterium]|nr:hypothetical protein [Deltaproteobacteria bacterium]
MILGRALPHLSILALIGALAATSWQALRVLERVPTNAAIKHQTADRVLVYRVTKDHGPRFLLDGGRPRLKLSSMGLVATTAGYDPTILQVYRLGLTVSHLDRELWRADVAVTSRQSKADWDGSQWAHEGAWSLDGVQLNDERVTIIELPEVPADAILELRLIGDGEVVLRAFQAESRDAAARERAAVRWDEQAKAESLRSSTYVPWSLLEPMERQQRLTRRWQRLSALGAAGVDFQTRAVFVSDFRTSSSISDAEGIEISRDRAAVLNVMGPRQVSIIPPSRTTIPLRIETLGPTTRSVSSPGGPLTVDVPPGAHSVIVSTDSVAPVVVRARADHDGWIVPLELRAATPPGQIVPDTVRIPMIMIGPGAVATVPVYPLGVARLLGRALRVDARIVLRPDVAAGAASNQATIRVSFRSRDGKELGHDTITITGVPARFERLEWDGFNVTPSEPSTFRVIAPPDAAHIDVTADRDVAASLFRWLPGEVERKPPYAQPPGPVLAWRYAPLLHRSWYAVSPENHEQLALARRVALLEAQVRIEASDGAEPVASTDEPSPPGPDPATTVVYETLPLPGIEQQRAREPVAPDDVDSLLRTWDPGAITELTPRQPRGLDFRAALRTSPRLSWAVPSAALGSIVEVTIGGIRREVRIDTLFGSTRLADIPAGQHRVVIDAPLDAQLWINRPPTSGRWGLYRDRTLYQLGRRPLRVWIPQARGEQIHVYAVIYAPPTAKARVRMSVDGGRPARRIGFVDRLTVAESITELAELVPASTQEQARLIDLGGRWAGTPRVVPLSLLDDLAAGRRRIEVTALSGPPMWIRLVATRTPGVTR